MEECLVEAEQQVARLAAEWEHPDTGSSLRQEAARERMAKERQERVEAAPRRMPEIQATKEHSKKGKAKAEREMVSEARVSTTDPEARVMKMPDGGYQPAYNLHLATDEQSQVIVGNGEDTTGNDRGQAPAMVDQIAGRTGQVPRAYLMDGGYARREDIAALER
jgi:hypothetical protein